MECHALVVVVVVVRALQFTVLFSQHLNICTMWLGSKVYRLLVLYSRQSPSAPSTSHVTSPHTLCSIRSSPLPYFWNVLSHLKTIIYVCFGLRRENLKNSLLLSQVVLELWGDAEGKGSWELKRSVMMRQKKRLWEELETMKRQKFNINGKKGEWCVQERKHERKRKLLMKMLRTSRS
jgi:hypothetical protein